MCELSCHIVFSYHAGLRTPRSSRLRKLLKPSSEDQWTVKPPSSTRRGGVPYFYFCSRMPAKKRCTPNWLLGYVHHPLWHHKAFHQQIIILYMYNDQKLKKKLLLRIIQSIHEHYVHHYCRETYRQIFQDSNRKLVAMATRIKVCLSYKLDAWHTN